MPISPSEAEYHIPPAPGAAQFEAPLHSVEAPTRSEQLVQTPHTMPQYELLSTRVDQAPLPAEVDSAAIQEVLHIDYELDTLRGTILDKVAA